MAAVATQGLPGSRMAWMSEVEMSTPKILTLSFSLSSSTASFTPRANSSHGVKMVLMLGLARSTALV